MGRKVLLTKPLLDEAIDSIRGAVMIAFPQGLPEWDLVRQALEDKEELAGTSVSIHVQTTPLLECTSQLKHLCPFLWLSRIPYMQAPAPCKLVYSELLTPSIYKTTQLSGQDKKEQNASS